LGRQIVENLVFGSPTTERNWEPLVQNVSRLYLSTMYLRLFAINRKYFFCLKCCRFNSLDWILSRLSIQLLLSWFKKNPQKFCQSYKKTEPKKNRADEIFFVTESIKTEPMGLFFWPNRKNRTEKTEPIKS